MLPVLNLDTGGRQPIRRVATALPFLHDSFEVALAAAAERLTLLPAAQEHTLAQENGKDRLVLAVTELSKAFALAVPHAGALAIRDDGYFSKP